MRVTISDLNELFPYFCKTIGIRQAQGYGDIGAYFIEIAPRGYRIARYLENGGTADDFGSLAVSAAELKSRMHFAIDCFTNRRNEK